MGASLQSKLKALNASSELAMEYAEREIPLLKNIMERLHKKGVYSFDGSLNIAIFSCIAEADLSILMVRMLHEQFTYEMTLFARVIALALHEYALDIQRMLSDLIKNELATTQFSAHRSDILQLNKRNTDFIKKNIKQLKQIRNNTIAHKTKQAVDLANLVYDTDPIDIFNIGLELMEISRQVKLEAGKITAKIK